VPAATGDYSGKFKGLNKIGEHFSLEIADSAGGGALTVKIFRWPGRRIRYPPCLMDATAETAQPTAPGGGGGAFALMQ
jgi:hypothetical protein